MSIPSRIRSRAVQGLIAGTLTLSCHFPDAEAAGTGASEEAFVEALVAEAESSGVESCNRQSILERLATSPRGTIRTRVADAAGALAREEPRSGLRLLRVLAHDPERDVRVAAARSLACFMAHVTGPLRAAVESEWTRADAAEERVMLATALGLTAPDWLTDLALEELAADRHAPVRRAALQAARAQLRTNPGAYVRLAAAHLDDRDRLVRKSARRALSDAEASAWLGGLRPSPSQVRESRQRFRRAMRRDLASLAREERRCERAA